MKEKKVVLNKLIREYFLLKAERRGDGKILCPLTKKWCLEKDMQVAHFIDRNRNATRFEKDNLLLTSTNSNIWDAKIPVEGYPSKHHKDYSEYLGKEKVFYLNESSKEDVILYESIYDNYIDLYTELISNIKTINK